MKHTILLPIITVLLLLFHNTISAKTIFQNKDQHWELVSIVNTADYTTIHCDITILNNRAGCFDAHLYDKRNSSIYIDGAFGKKNLYKSTFEGDYKPWKQWSGYIEWNYYERFQKGKICHATFYFARIPAGIESVNFHFYGGWTNEDAECDKYECPRFEARELVVVGNPNTTLQTNWTEFKLRDYWSTHTSSVIEGIYTFFTTNNFRWWGPIRHRIAVKKEGDDYYVIYLAGANDNVWKAGEIKGVFNLTTTAGLYKVRDWYIETKMLSGNDFFIMYDKRYLTLYDNYSGIETIFAKLYPEEDIDKLLSDKQTPKDKVDDLETETPKGNGSGFFVGKDVIATNYHVVKDAQRINVVLCSYEDVQTYSAKVLCSDKVNDLALIQVIDTTFSTFAHLPYSLYSNTLSMGESIFTLGYPMADIMGNDVKLTDGIISSKTGYQGDISHYQISAPIQSGNSGGPVFDRNGHVVGIISSGIVGAENVGYAIKTSFLKNLIEASPIEIEYIFSNKISNQSLSEQAQIFSPFVALILIY